MKRLAFLVLLAMAVSRSAGEEARSFPDFITPCRPKDDKCLKDTLEQLRPYLLRGIPEFGIPPMDHLRVPNYNQSNHPTPQFGYDLIAEDLQYEGAADFTVSKAHFDEDEAHFDLELAFPRITLTVIETVTALGFGVKVNGTGYINGTFSNVTVGFSLNGTNRSHSHLNLEEELVTVAFDDVVYAMDDSYQGRGDFDALLKEILGRPEIFKPELGNLLKNTFAKYILRVIQLVHENYTLDVLYDLSKSV